jgi:predicted transcriptional regulator
MLPWTEFGTKVRVAVVQKNMTLPQVAKKVGISYAYLYDILHGYRDGKRHIKKIIEAVGLEESSRG